MFLVMALVIFCTTVGSEEKLAACKGLGADVCINYKTEDFVERIKQETNGKGINRPPDYIWSFTLNIRSELSYAGMQPLVHEC